MRLPKFEVEDVIEMSGTGNVVFARKLEDGDFVVRNGLKLGGYEISAGDMPRNVNQEGSQRLDLWGFWLANDEDVKFFKKGEVVELSQDE